MNKNGREFLLPVRAEYDILERAVRAIAAFRFRSSTQMKEGSPPRGVFAGSGGPERGAGLEKRRVTISIGGQAFGLYSDDSDAYIDTLEQRANAVLKRTAGSGEVLSLTNAMLSVIALTDELLRTERKNQQPTGERKAAGSSPSVRRDPAKDSTQTPEKDRRQISVWDLLGDA